MVWEVGLEVVALLLAQWRESRVMDAMVRDGEIVEALGMANAVDGWRHVGSCWQGCIWY